MIKDLPEPLVNTTLNGDEADFHWPDRKLVVEVDGPGHGRPRTQREDARKEAAWPPATRSCAPLPSHYRAITRAAARQFPCQRHRNQRGSP